MADNHWLSVGCIVRKGNGVLLVRHTYGGAKGKLLIPGGHCEEGELPSETAMREVMEETKVTAKPVAMLGVRCHRNGWYAIMVMDYVEGTPTSDNWENSEALFCDVQEALEREDVTHMTKVALQAMLRENPMLHSVDEEYKKHKGPDYELYM